MSSCVSSSDFSDASNTCENVLESTEVPSATLRVYPNEVIFATDKPLKNCCSSAVDGTLNDLQQPVPDIECSRLANRSTCEETSVPQTFLILENRPCGLPPKDESEQKKHLKAYNNLVTSLKKKHEQTQKPTAVASIVDIKRDDRKHNLVRVWQSEIIPRWSHFRGTKRVRRLVWEGIPSVVRRDVWWLLSGDSLNINRALFDQCLAVSHERLRTSTESVPNGSHNPSKLAKQESVCSMCSMVFTNLNSAPLQHEICFGFQQESFCDSPDPSPPIRQNSLTSPFYHLDRNISLRCIRLDVSRTFPSLGLFQPGNPYHEPLHDLLAAYVTYKPDTGYVQGMSFLAAILLLVAHDAYDAFVMFANILERPCHRAFYSLDENEFVIYFRAFDATLADRLPRLHSHFKQVGLEPNMYLFDWFFTVFSRSLPLDADMRVWDLFFLDGELALFRAALGILHLYEDQLLRSNFDQLALFLTGSLPSELSADCLVKQMRLVGLKKKHMLNRVNAIRNEVSNATSSHPYGSRTQVKRFFVHCAALANGRAAQPSSATSTSGLPRASNPESNSPEQSCSVHNVSPGHVDHSVVSLCSVSRSASSTGSEEKQVGDGIHHFVPNGYALPPRNSNGSSVFDWSLPENDCSSPCNPLPLNRAHCTAKSSCHSRPDSVGPRHPSDQRLRVYLQRMIERVP